MTGGGNAVGSGVRRRAAVDRDDADLTHRRLAIGGGQLLEHLVGCSPGGEQLEAEGAVAAVGERLRGDGADSRARPRHGLADGEEPRLHGDTELPRVAVECDQRVGHRSTWATYRD